MRTSTMILSVVGAVAGAGLMHWVTTFTPYKLECGVGMHGTVTEVWNNDLASGQSKMLEVWDDVPATQIKGVPVSSSLVCNAKARFSRGGDRAIAYWVTEERGKTWNHVRLEAPLVN
jgi:hypothetical protein